ncbi:MAG: hypothetical protein ABI680_06555 [Chthoniobacteraceae bacterium]
MGEFAGDGSIIARQSCMRHLFGLIVAALVGMLAAYVWRPLSSEPRLAPNALGPQSGLTSPAHSAAAAAHATTDAGQAHDLRDPVAAVKTALDSWPADPLEAQSVLYELFQHFTAQDFQQITRDADTFDRLMEGRDYLARRAFVEGMVVRWLAVDEDAAFAWLASNPKATHPNDGMAGTRYECGAGIETFARLRPERMLTHVISLSPSDNRRVMAAALIRTVGGSDIKLAKEWIERFDDPGTRMAAERGYLEAMARLDPLSVLDSAKALPRNDADAVWDAATTEALRRGSSAVTALAEKADSPLQKMNIAQQLRFTHPEAAAALITDQAATDPHFLGSKTFAPWVAADYARRDLEKARAWAMALPSDVRAAPLQTVMREWAATDPRAALDWLAANREMDAMPAAAATRAAVFASWLNANEAGARAYADALPAGPDKDAAQTALVSHLCRHQRPAAAVALFGQVPDSERGKLAAEIARTMAGNDPLEATTWAVSLPPGEEQTQAITSIVDAWSWTNAAAVASWIEKFPVGDVRDQAVGAFISRVGSLDTASAAEWVLQIRDPWKRALAAQKVFGYLRVRDSAAAITWLEELPGIDETIRTTTLHESR